MIVRKFSFFLLFPLTLAFTLYTRDIRWCTVLLLCTGMIGAGCGITFLAQDYSPGVKQAGFYIIACALGISFGFSLSVRMMYHTAKVYTGLEIPAITSFSGTCVKDSIPARKKGYTHYIDLITVHSDVLGVTAQARGRVMVISETGSRLFTGETIEITSRLSSADPGQNIQFICYAKGRDVTRIGYSNIIFRMRRQLYNGVVSKIDNMGYPASALFQTLFLGSREELPTDMYEGFEKTGTLHILALSGLHVGIIYALAGLLLFFLPWPWVKYMTGFCIILFYLFIVGPRPSLVRATVMIIVIGIGYILSLEREPLNLLGIACSLILIADPFSAFSLSFQLSFLALLGIFIISTPITAFLKQYLPGWIALPLSFSIGAQIATAPVVFIHFGKVYPTGIIVTLLLIPLVTVFLWGGILFLLLNNINLPFIREPGEFFFSFLYKIIYVITSIFKRIPGITVRWEWWHWIIFFICILPFLLNIRILGRTRPVVRRIKRVEL